MNVQKASLFPAKQPSRIALIIAAGLVFISATAHAANKSASRVQGQYTVSRAPLYAVGTYNKKLSALCRQGLFRQNGDLRLSIGYVGPKAYGITGIANKEFNLYDPTHVAEADKTYHFHNQGYSNCQVFVAKKPINRPRKR